MASSDLILNDYRASIREINRLFLIGLFFALAVHFYVIEPYFHFKSKELSLQNSLPSMKQSIKELLAEENRILEAHQSAATALQEIRENLLRFPDQLRTALPDITASLARRGIPAADQFPNETPALPQYNQYVQQKPPPGIAVPTDITSLDAAVNWYVNRWFTELLAELETRVVKPMTVLDHAAGSQKGQDLKEICRNAMDSAKKSITAIDSHFWHSYGGSGGKVDTAAEIRDNIAAAFAPLEKEVGDLLEKTNRQRQSQEEKLSGLNSAIADTTARIAFLSDRLKAIESPFGPLPLRMTDLIKIFPFLLAALAVKLAHAMHQGAIQQALLQQLSTDQHDALPPALMRYHLRSMLLSPTNRLLAFLSLSSWLLVLIAVFIRSAWLITGNPQVLTDVGQQEILIMNPYPYKAGCLTGLALLVGAGAAMLKTSQPGPRHET